MQGIAPSYQAQYDGVPLDPPPSPRQGFGRLDLGATLPYQGTGSTAPNLRVCRLQVCSKHVEPER